MDGSLIAALGVGFLAGLRHALEADHVAAVSTFATQERSVLRACLRGTFWGIGHTTALLGAGVAMIAFKLRMSPELERATETLVALALILLGGHVLLRALAAASGPLPHAHPDGERPHRHGDGPLHRHGPWRGAPQPLLMGLLHGLAGGGALALLALTSLPSTAAALAYIVVFGVGATLGMLALSGLIGIPFSAGAGVSRGLAQGLQVAVGACSALVGLSMLLGRAGGG